MQTSPSSFIILNAVDSTNNYAMAKVHAGTAKHGDAFFATQQTGGKGQRGKAWQSEPGQNIILTVVLEPEGLKISQQFHLSVAVSLACHEFFSRYAGDETTIKWPNDIYWRDRKAGGILIENVIGRTNVSSNWKFAIVGIGININQTVFAAGSGNPVSLKQITGKNFDPVLLAHQLHETVLKKLAETKKDPFEKLLQSYNQCLYKINQPVKLRKGNIVFESVLKAVTEKGLLYTTDTIDNYFDFGEVEWVL